MERLASGRGSKELQPQCWTVVVVGLAQNQSESMSNCKILVQNRKCSDLQNFLLLR